MKPTAEAKPSARSGIAERYRLLVDIGRTLTDTLSTEDLYREICRGASRVLEAAGFYISLYDADRDLATIVFYADRGQDRRVEITYRGSESDVIRTGKAALVQDRAEMKSVLVVGEEGSDVTRSSITALSTHSPIARISGAVMSHTAARQPVVSSRSSRRSSERSPGSAQSDSDRISPGASRHIAKAPSIAGSV